MGLEVCSKLLHISNRRTRAPNILRVNPEAAVWVVQLCVQSCGNTLGKMLQLATLYMVKIWGDVLVAKSTLICARERFMSRIEEIYSVQIIKAGRQCIIQVGFRKSRLLIEHKSWHSVDNSL